MSAATTVKPSRWKGVAGGLFFVLFGLVIWDGADRRAVDASRPLSHGPTLDSTKAATASLKVGSFNIHGGKGVDGLRNLARTTALLTDLDLVGLYEVRATQDPHLPNQAAAIASNLHSSWLFAPTERQWWSDYFGNGLIYRVPVRSVTRIPLVNTRGKAYRNVVLSTVEVQEKEVHILSVHIDRENDRQQQLQSVIDLFMSLREPCLLMGDLNTTEADPLIIKLRGLPGVHSPLHESLVGGPPNKTIDWIFTRGLKTVAATLVNNEASDHPLIRGEFVPLVDQ